MQACVKFAPAASRVGRSLLRIARADTAKMLLAASPSTIKCNTFASTSANLSTKYAVVDHSEAYESAMEGAHGRQLALARLEGEGKDDPPFNPFEEEELAAIDFNDNEDDTAYDDDVVEAEVVGDDDDEDEDSEGDDDEEDDESALESTYNPDGSIRRKSSVLASLEAGFPAGGQFAVFELGGAQFKATTDDVLVANRLQPVKKYKIGSTHTLNDIMLVGSSHKTLVGIPYVAGAEVDVMVEEITRDAKVTVFKKRRRKNSQRKNGFRRDITLLRVLDIRMPEEYRDHTHIGREIIDSLDEHFEKELSYTYDVLEDPEPIKESTIDKNKVEGIKESVKEEDTAATEKS